MKLNQFVVSGVFRTVARMLEIRMLLLAGLLSLVLVAPMAHMARAQQASGPVFTPRGGALGTRMAVQIESRDAAGSIHFTTNGKDPTRADPTMVSGSSVLVIREFVLKAATWNGEQRSPVTSGTFHSRSAVAAGNAHLLALGVDGQVAGWGLNTNGQLGIGTVQSPQKTPVPTGTLGAGQTRSGVAAIAAGAKHSLFLEESNGAVYACGDNINGQLGDGTALDRRDPTLVLNPDRSGFEQVARIAAGDNHSLAMKRDGSLWGWGRNANGQLGIGSTAGPQKFPTRVLSSGTVPLEPVIAFSAGMHHSLAVTEGEGRVWAWGSNTYSQLGDGSGTQRLFPVRVLTSSGMLTGAVQGACGENFSIACKGDGTVWAWGCNTNGQLGIGSLEEKAFAVPVLSSGNPASNPVPLTGVVAIAVGDRHVLALQADGTLWAWGLNAHGQLGDGTLVQRKNPVRVLRAPNVPLEGIVAIAAGSDCSIAMDQDGHLFTWGLPTSGQLGNGSSSSSSAHYACAYSTLPPMTLPAASLCLTSDTTSLIAPAKVRLAITATDPDRMLARVELFRGMDLLHTSLSACPFTYECKDLPTGSYNFRARAVDLNGKEVVSETLAVTVQPPSVAITSSAEEMVEFDESGQPGNPEGTFVVSRSFSGPDAPDVPLSVSLRASGNARLGEDYESVPSTITIPAGSRSVEIPIRSLPDMQIEGDETITLSLEAQAAYTLGSASVATIILRDAPPSVSVRATANAGSGLGGTPVAGNFRFARTGPRQALSVTYNIHTSSIAGTDYVALTGRVDFPRGITEVDVPVTPIVAVKSSKALAVVISPDPKYIVASGSGRATIELEMPSGEIAGGARHVLARRASGELYSMGLQTNGRLGNNETAAADENCWQSVLKGSTGGGFQDAIAISAGADHSLAVDASGLVYGFGENSYGQLGNGTTILKSIATGALSGTNGELLGDTLAVSAGNSFSLALRGAAKRTVYAWGLHHDGRLGNGLFTGITKIATPVMAGISEPVPLSGIRKIAAGDNHALALDDTGSVWSWGSNNVGQLGDGTRTPRARALAVHGSGTGGNPLLSDVVEIAAGNDFSVAVCQGAGEQGTVWCWGQQTYGALGNRLSTSGGVETPVPVLTGSNPQLSGTLSNVVQVACGATHVLALDSSGQVWSWGANNYGQLGSETPTTRAYAAQVNFPAEMDGKPPVIIRIGAGGLGLAGWSHAISSRGRVYSWGYNGQGQLGAPPSVAQAWSIPQRKQELSLTNNPPTLSLTITPNSVPLMAPESLRLSVCASDSDGSVIRTQVFQGSTLLGTFLRSGECVFNCALPGTYAFSATTTDDDGNLVSTSVQKVTVIPPRVGVTIEKGTAVEPFVQSGTNAVLRVSRTSRASQPAPLLVNYRLHGTATMGEDYAGLSGTLQIPTGQSYCDLVIAPLKDLRFEEAETVTLTLIPNPGYEIDSNASASVTIENRTPPPLVASGTSLYGFSGISLFIPLHATDPLGAPLVFSANQPLHGSTTVTGSTAVYVPNPDWSGTDSFTFHASKGEISASNTVTVVMLPAPSISIVPIGIKPFSLYRLSASIPVDAGAGTVESVRWSVLGTGSNMQIVNPEAATTDVRVSEPGIYQICLELNFSSGHSTTKQVTLRALPEDPAQDSSNWYWRYPAGVPDANNRAMSPYLVALDSQRGIALSPTGVMPERFPQKPWFLRIKANTAFLASPEEGDWVYAAPDAFENPVAAFGSGCGGTPLYLNQNYRFGVGCGFILAERPEPDLRITVYNRESLLIGDGLVPSATSRTFRLPRPNEESWKQFQDRGFVWDLHTEELGLTTTVQYVPDNATAASSLIVTHLGHSPDKLYCVEFMGSVQSGTAMLPMASSVAGPPTSIPVKTGDYCNGYTLEFDQRQSWESTFIDQPHFFGTPLPSAYQGKTMDELIRMQQGTAQPIVDNFPLPDPMTQYPESSNSPELRRHPLLDQFARDMAYDPMAIANYVLNEIELTDAVIYVKEEGASSAINCHGVSRGALGTFLEGQGSPVDQCALLIYLLRQCTDPATGKKIPCRYVFPNLNETKVLAEQMSRVLRMQLTGSETSGPQVLSVNYPWVAAHVGGKWVHLFPWLKDTVVKEGLDFYNYMPEGCRSAMQWVHGYLRGNPEMRMTNHSDPQIQRLAEEYDNPGVLFPLYIQDQLRRHFPDVGMEDLGVVAYNRRNYFTQWADFPRPWQTGSLESFNLFRSFTEYGSPFDSIQVTVTDPTGSTLIDAGTFNALDLHNHRLLVHAVHTPELVNPDPEYVTYLNGQKAVNTWLRLSVEAFSPGTPRVFYSGFLSSARAAFYLNVTHNRYAPYFGGSTTSCNSRPFARGDMVALCNNFGRVTAAMVDVQARQYWAAQQTQDPKAPVDVEISQGIPAYLCGMSYYKKISDFKDRLSALTKYNATSFIGCGLSVIAGKPLQTRPLLLLPTKAGKVLEPGDVIKLKIPERTISTPLASNTTSSNSFGIPVSFYNSTLVSATNSRPSSMLFAAPCSWDSDPDSGFGTLPDESSFAVSTTTIPAMYFYVRYEGSVPVDLSSAQQVRLLSGTGYSVGEMAFPANLRTRFPCSLVASEGGGSGGPSFQWKEVPAESDVLAPGMILSFNSYKFEYRGATRKIGPWREPHEINSDEFPVGLLQWVSFPSKDTAIFTFGWLEPGSSTNMYWEPEPAFTSHTKSITEPCTLLSEPSSTGRTPGDTSSNPLTISSLAKEIQIAWPLHSGVVENAILEFEDRVLPRVDMCYENLTVAGNHSIHPDSALQQATNDWNWTPIFIAEAAAQEHRTINHFYGKKDAISTVKLLDLANAKAVSGMGPGLIAIHNAQELLAIGSQVYSCGANYKALKDCDPGMWNSVVQAFSGANAPFSTVLMTPGAIQSVPENGASAYSGLGAFIFETNSASALISGNMNGGSCGSYLPQDFYEPAPLSFSLKVLTASFGEVNLSSINNTYTSLSSFASPSIDLLNFNARYNAIWSGESFLSPTSIQAYNQQVQLTGYNSPLISANFGYTNQAVAADVSMFFQNTGFLGQTSDYRSIEGALGKGVYDPVNSVTGEFYHDAIDLKLAGPFPLEIRRNYGSQNLGDNQFGYGWKLSYFPFLVRSSTASEHNILYAAEMDGSVIAYRKEEGDSNRWIPRPEDNPALANMVRDTAGSVGNVFHNRLEQDGNTYTLRGVDGSVRAFEVRSFPTSGTNGLTRERPYLTRWTDHRGNSLQFSFGVNPSTVEWGQLVRIKSSNGNYLGFSYNANGHIVEAFTGDGRRLRYDYDDSGDLVKVTLPDGTSEEYDYQHSSQTSGGVTEWASEHLIIRERKPQGRILENSYDAQRRVVEQRATVGSDNQLYRTASFTYSQTVDPADHTISGYTIITDAKESPTRYDYTKGQITKITDALNQVTEEVWYQTDDPATGAYRRSLAKKTDKRGLVTGYKYDVRGNLLERTETGNLKGTGTSTASWKFEYNERNLLDKAIDPAGIVTKYVYGTEPGRTYLPVSVIKQTVQGEEICQGTMEYEDVVEQGCSARGLLLRSIEANGTPDQVVTTFTNDGHGFPLSKSIGTSATSSLVRFHYQYNLRGELTKETDPSGRSTLFAYDGRGNQVWKERHERDGRLVDWRYDYFNENGEIEWSQGSRYNPVDYTIRRYDRAGHLAEEIKTRSEASQDGNGVQACQGEETYSITSYHYDLVGNLLEIRDPRHNSMTMQYDAVGQMIGRQVHEGGADAAVIATESFPEHEPGGNPAKFVSPLGGVTAQKFNSRGQVYEQVSADGTILKWAYDLSGRLREETLPNNSRRLTDYDPGQRTMTVTLVASGSNITQTRMFDRRGNPIWVTDAEGNTVATEYDCLNRPLSTTAIDATGSSPAQGTVHDYDDANSSHRVTNANGESTETNNDALGRPLQVLVKNANGEGVRFTSFAYSEDRQSVTQTSGSTAAVPIVATTYSDSMGRPVLVRTGSTFSSTRFDAGGNPVAIRNPQGLISLSHYDALNRLVEQWTPSQSGVDGARSTWVYGNDGKTVEQHLPGGNIAFTWMDQAGRKIAEELGTENSNARTRHFDYSYYSQEESSAPGACPGKLKQITDPRGVHSLPIYDGFGRTRQVASTGATPEQNQTTAWLYDRRNLVTQITQQYADPATGPATLTEFTYDGLGQKQTESVWIDGALFNSWEQSWNAVGRRTSLSSLIAPQGQGAFSFEYRADGLLESTKYVRHACNFFYEDHGLLSARVNSGRVLTVDARDALGRIKNVSNNVAGNLVLGAELTWRNDSRIESFTENRNGTSAAHTYTYNDRGQLLNEGFLDRSGSNAFTYQFDGNQKGTGPGVRTLAQTQNAPSISGSAIPNGFQQVALDLQAVGGVPANSTTWDHDSLGYAVSASSLTSGTQKLKWDSLGRLIGVESIGTDGKPHQWSAIYDGLGRRIRVIQESPASGSGTNGNGPTIIDSFYDPQVEFLELGVAVNGVRTWKLHGPDLSGRYGSEHGIGGLELLIEENGVVTPVINDYFGNVAASISGTTVSFAPGKAGAYGMLPDSEIPILDGNETTTTSSILALCTAWRGKRLDATGYYYLGARYYNPQTGRFLSPDPLGHAASTSLYDYANGDPVNGLDPDGRCGFNLQASMDSSALSGGLATLLYSGADLMSAMDRQSGVQYGGAPVRYTDELSASQQLANAVFSLPGLNLFRAGMEWSTGKDFVTGDPISASRDRGLNFLGAALDTSLALAPMPGPKSLRTFESPLMRAETRSIGSALMPAQAGSGGGQWKVQSAVWNHSNTVEQFHKDACGPAIAQMLLADRGVSVTQQEISAEMKVILSTHLDLRGGLNSFHGGWDSSQVKYSSLAMLCRGGSWGAMMRVDGGFHWVAVDGKNEFGNILLRDPADRSLIEMTEKDFLDKWTSYAVWHCK